MRGHFLVKNPCHDRPTSQKEDTAMRGQLLCKYPLSWEANLSVNRNCHTRPTCHCHERPTSLSKVLLYKTYHKDPPLVLWVGICTFRNKTILVPISGKPSDISVIPILILRKLNVDIFNSVCKNYFIFRNKIQPNCWFVYPFSVLFRKHHFQNNVNEQK